MQHEEAYLRPDNSGRSSVLMTTLGTFQLVSPYLPPLALNRTEFPEGGLPRGFFPIRYIVGRASHSVIGATVACRPRGLVGIHQVLIYVAPPFLSTYNNATSGRN